MSLGFFDGVQAAVDILRRDLARNPPVEIWTGHRDINHVLMRFERELDTHNDTELAQRMRVPLSQLQSWRARGQVDIAELTRAAAVHRLNLPWLLEGTGVPRGKAPN